MPAIFFNVGPLVLAAPWIVLILLAGAVHPALATIPLMGPIVFMTWRAHRQRIAAGYPGVPVRLGIQIALMLTAALGFATSF